MWRALVCSGLHAAMILWTASCGRGVRASETVVRTDGWRSRVVVDDLPGLAAITVRPNGQSILAIDTRTRTVLALESADPSRRRTVLAPLDGAGEPVAIACIDSSTVAILIAGADGMPTIGTYRLQPSGDTPQRSVAIQTQPIPGWARTQAAVGGIGPTSLRTAMAVSPGREWLVVARGFDQDRPEPAGLGAPPLLRAPIAGSRLGPLGIRHCPARPASALTVSPGGELVLLEPTGSGTDLVLYARTQGTQLLRLPTGLTDVAAVSYGRDGTLWAAATSVSDKTQGLWRLDAVMLGGRQGVRSTCVALVENPVAVVPSGEGHLAVLAGIEGSRRLLVVERESRPGEEAGVPGRR